ncbi:MAG: GNAT family N-acetyltransferase [Anaerolineae bacterium]|nr:GNAT family N-acetyltransferase [Anaerolineae bacterium]
MSRPYSEETDPQAMLDLLMAVRPAERISGYPSPVDLLEMLVLNVVQDNARLWFDGDALVGFALVDHYCNLCFDFVPAMKTPGIESEIVAWGETCIRRRMQESGESLTLDASCHAGDERVAMLERHGFVAQPLRSLCLTRPLSAPIPAPQLPDGFSLRHVAGEHEVAALVALHQAAHGTENFTVEERLAMMRGPDYEAELDLLAVAPDGRLAASCMVAIYREENSLTGRNEGYTDPVATHPDFQRRGLAKALLLAGLHLLRQRDVDTAVLGTGSDNLAMQRAAASVGFQVTSTTLWFSKPVSPAPVAE